MASLPETESVPIPKRRPTTVEEYKEYTQWLVSLHLPKEQKSPSENERFIKLLNQTVRHPQKMRLLPNSEQGQDQVDCDDEFSCFGGTLQPEMLSKIISCGACVASISGPASSSHTAPGGNSTLHDKSFLSETILNAQAATLHFEKALMDLESMTARFRTYAQDLNYSTPKTGLHQLTGFCEQLQMVATPITAGLKILNLTSKIGLGMASEFLQNPSALLHESNVPCPYEGPTLEENLEAKVKITNGQDEAIRAYTRLGKSGFKGDWASKNGQNLAIAFYEEVEKIILELLKGSLELSKWIDTVFPVFNTFVYTDATEKSFLMTHIKSMRIHDQMDVIQRVDFVREVNQCMYQILKRIDLQLTNIHLNLDYYEMTCQGTKVHEPVPQTLTPYCVADTVAQLTAETPSSSQPTRCRMPYTNLFDIKNTTHRPAELDEVVLDLQNMQIMEELVSDKIERMGDSIWRPKHPTFPLDDPPRRKD